MKLLLRAMAIFILSAFCMQIINTLQIPVKARKKDPEKDKRSVTVEIEIPGSRKKPKVTFTKDTTRLLRGKLYFDFGSNDQNTNTIFVTYKGQSASYTITDKPRTGDPRIRRIVSKSDVPDNPEIVLDDTIIDIVDSKAPSSSALPEKRKATVKVPRGSGQWILVSGTVGLTSRIAEKDANIQNPQILDRGTAGAFDGNLFIYINKPTALYVKKEGSNTYKISKLEKTALQKAGENPVIDIDSDGKATIMSEDGWKMKQQAHSTKSTQPEAVSMLTPAPASKSLSPIIEEPTPTQEEHFSITADEMLNYYNRTRQSDKERLLKFTQRVHSMQDIDSRLKGALIAAENASPSGAPHHEFLKRLNAIYTQEKLAKYKPVLVEIISGIERSSQPITTEGMLDYYNKIQDAAVKKIVFDLTEQVRGYAVAGGITTALKKEIKSHIKPTMDPMAREFLVRLNDIYSTIPELQKHTNVLMEVVQGMKAVQ